MEAGPSVTDRVVAVTSVAAAAEVLVVVPSKTNVFASAAMSRAMWQRCAQTLPRLRIPVAAPTRVLDLFAIALAVMEVSARMLRHARDACTAAKRRAMMIASSSKESARV